MPLEGWICLWRRLLESEEWRTMTDGQRCVMVAVLLLANWEDDPGRLDCGEETIATKARVSRKVVRGALSRLTETGFIGPRKGPRRGAKDGRLQTSIYYVQKWDDYQGEGQGKGQGEGPRDYIQQDLTINTTCSPSFHLEHPTTKQNKGSNTTPRVPKEHVRPAIDAYIAAMKQAHGVDLTPTQPMYVAMRNVVKQLGADKALRLAGAWPLVDNPSALRAGYPIAWIPNNAPAIEMFLSGRKAQANSNFRPVVDE